MARLRDIILSTVDAILENQNDAKDKIRYISNLHDLTTQRNTAFLIENMVYGSFLHVLMDEEVQHDQVWLQNIKSQVLGQKPYVHTYALKYPFVELLTDEPVEAYKELIDLFGIISRSSHKSPGSSIGYEDLRESLFERINDRFIASTIPELLVVQASHFLLELPDDVSYFDAMQIFSSKFPKTSMVPVASSLAFVEKLIHQLIGEVILYVTVTNLRDGNFSINLH